MWTSYMPLRSCWQRSATRWPRGWSTLQHRSLCTEIWQLETAWLMQMGSSRWETLVCLKMFTYQGTSDWTRNLEESNYRSSGWLQKAFRMECSMRRLICGHLVWHVGKYSLSEVSRILAWILVISQHFSGTVEEWRNLKMQLALKQCTHWCWDVGILTLRTDLCLPRLP